MHKGKRKRNVLHMRAGAVNIIWTSRQNIGGRQYMDGSRRVSGASSENCVSNSLAHLRVGKQPRANKSSPTWWGCSKIYAVDRPFTAPLGTACLNPLWSCRGRVRGLGDLPAAPTAPAGLAHGAAEQRRAKGAYPMGSQRGMVRPSVPRRTSS